MKRLQIYLTEKQYQEIKEISYNNDVTLSQSIRWSIDYFITQMRAEKKLANAEVPPPQSLHVSNNPDEKYIFDPEVLQFLREFEVSKDDK